MFHKIFYMPLYNALMAFTNLFGGSLGLAVIGLTLALKIVLLPFANQSLKSQAKQRQLQPLMDEIRKNYPDKKEQGEKMMELYKAHKTSPFSGCLVTLVQFPVLIAIYWVFKAGAAIVPADFYSFIHIPLMVKSVFLGIDLTKPTIILAIVAAISTYLQLHFSPAMKQAPTVADPADSQAVMMAGMQKYMKYGIPVLILIAGIQVPGAASLYWIISNLFTMVHERIIAKKIAK